MHRISLDVYLCLSERGGRPHRCAVSNVHKGANYGNQHCENQAAQNQTESRDAFIRHGLFGPYVFNGLPGLITFISDTDRNHIFELTKLSKENFNYMTNNFKTISKTDFKNMEFDYKTDPVRLLLPESNIINSEEQQEIKRKLKEKIKNDNNPIELKDE